MLHSHSLEHEDIGIPVGWDIMDSWRRRRESGANSRPQPKRRESQPAAGVRLRTGAYRKRGLRLSGGSSHAGFAPNQR